MAPACSPEPGSEGPPRNLLLVTLDTTRFDHLGPYGYERDTTPTLDRLALRARIHTQAYSTTSWTLPAHASLFTGLFPSSHGARLDAQGPLLLRDAVRGDRVRPELRASPLAAGIPTLAGILGAAGFHTGAVVAGPWLKRVFGLDRGFAHYDDTGADRLAGARADDVTGRAVRWLAGLPAGPFFLFVNYFDPHGPYDDPDGHGERYLAEIGPEAGPAAGLRARYDGEIRFMDHHLGRLLERMDDLGRLAETLIVVTADHGELLGEHGIRGHNRFLYQELIRVPLLMVVPGDAGAMRIDTPIQLTDVFAVVLELLGVGLPEALQGTSGAERGGAVFAEVHPLEVQSAGGSRYALVQGNHKLLIEDDRIALFDLSTDPGERNDLASELPSRVSRLHESLRALLAGLPPPRQASSAEEIDPETRRALDALGYLE